MIRFRIGHRWKREPADPPHDSVSLELDGVNLLPGAVEEPLVEAVPALVGAVAELHAGGRRLAQVSLAEAHLELVLRRSGTDIELQVASLSRPARQLHPPVRLDAEELAEAARACGRAFLEDITGVIPRMLSEAPRQELERALRRLEEPAHPLEERRPEPFIRRVAPPTLPGFGFALDDPDDVLRRSVREKGPELASLLCPGEVWLSLPERPVAWRAQGPPFLTALELARQAADLARAVELGEPRFGFEPAGVRPELMLDLKAGEARLGGATFPLRAEALVAAMYHLGQALAVTMSERERSLASNPYLVELTERCREGLSHLRGAVQPPEESGTAMARTVPPPGASRPLKVPGRLRRLRFDDLWEQRKLADADQGRLMLGRQGPVYSSPQMACAFDRKAGKQLWRRAATHGVAASTDGYSLAASAVRVCGFQGRGSGARWLHDHDGLRIGPMLLRQEGLLLTLSDDRIALAFNEVTGREMWRLAPPRTRRSHLGIQAHRALLATDSGYLYGLDLADGQVRFRVSASLPFLGPPVPWGRHFVAPLGQGSHFALLLSDAHTGEAAWTYEMSLSLPSVPLPSGKRLYVAGELEGEGVLVCLDSTGQTRWQRVLHLGPGPFALARLPGGVLVTSALGAAARMSDEGEVDWRVGAAGEQLTKALPPIISRGVVLVPGERVRAVDPDSGNVLAEVRAGAGLMALQADSHLNLYFLDELGTLSAYQLVSHFAVVSN
ncbi:PQQ-binding-like beta-propeller repeat protein [Archangium sp.]|uniref:outer membrane protein assembly factor BamB family protein n=1 Tax=Archangium sp. TaxID=1872627 RepID=UPI002D5988C7|nr:PQQ-binding-like beta-propeller repeat protein [Archangium sp.]HYO52754.1 PQQ-binding-like beta-propeller repeat protein [Archangium sp.]